MPGKKGTGVKTGRSELAKTKRREASGASEAPVSPRSGRPSRPHGAGRSAPVLSVRLDAEFEAALDALVAAYGSGYETHGLASRRAIVGVAEDAFPVLYRAALARVRKRRDADAE